MLSGKSVYAQEFHYDVNNDGHVNITDAILVVNYILGKTAEGEKDNAPCEAVDLGLPSGTKWASCNVGATKPEEYGGYYAWGETEEKDYYDLNTYIHCDGTKETCHNLGEISGTEYDVASMKWGGEWCIPTKDDFQELLDNCTIETTELNNVLGCMFISKVNGNRIFLPAAGQRWKDYYSRVGEHCHYWTSTPSSLYVQCAYSFESGLGFAYLNYDNDRRGGRCVRPVLK